MTNYTRWISRYVALLLLAVFVLMTSAAGAQQLSMPVSLSALTSPGTSVIWGQFEFSGFVLAGAATGVTVSGSSQGHLHGLSFTFDPGSLDANGSGTASRLDLRYVVRPVSGGSRIGGIELTTSGVTTGLGFAINAFTFYDNSSNGLATPLGLGTARYMGPTRDVEVLRESTAGLTVSGSFSARTVLAADHASMSLSTHRFVVSSDIPNGDYDLNGIADGADFLKWQRSFGEGPDDGVALNPNLDADGNRNGKIDAADFSIWRENYGVEIGPPGDFNGDGNVDGADFLRWQRALGTSDPAVDAIKNGVVDGADLSVWREHYGASGPSNENNLTAVPEPRTMWLMGIGVGVAVAILRNNFRR